MKLIALMMLTMLMLLLAGCGDPNYREQIEQPVAVPHHGPQIRPAEVATDAH